MITSTEAPVAMRALEGFLTGVFTVVAREFVAAREPPRAPLPRALIGLLPRVRALVRL